MIFLHISCYNEYLTESLCAFMFNKAFVVVIVNSEWHRDFFILNINNNQLVKYHIIINYEYGQFLHFTSIIDI